MTGLEMREEAPYVPLQITAAQRRFLVSWTVCIVLLYGIGGWLCVRQLAGYKADTLRKLQALAAWNRVPPEAAPDATGTPVAVHVKMALDRISDVETQGAGWTAEFRIGFRWTGNQVDPGEHFQLANGNVLEKERTIDRTIDGDRYVQYHVTARMTKAFDPARAPVGDESLTLQVVDGVDPASRLRYVVDENSIDIGHLNAPPSLNITRTLPIVRERRATGDGDLLGSPHDTQSVFIAGMLARTSVTSRYFRLLQALFAGVAITMIVFFIKPIHVDPRFGLPVGAFFAAVSNNIYVSSLVPEAGQITLIQMINAISLATIFLTLVASVTSLWVFDSLEHDRLRRLFDRASFSVCLVGFVVVNALLPFAAMPTGR